MLKCRKAYVAVVAAAALLFFAACSRPEARPPGGAIWISEESSPIADDQLGLLREARIGELFIEAATLEWHGGAARLTPRSVPSLPRPTPAVLVVRGFLPPLEIDIGRAAEAIGRELARIQREAEPSLLAGGVHLDFTGAPGPAGTLALYAALLEDLRGPIGRETRLSATVERSWLEDEDLGAVLDELDLAVAFLYGQRPGESEEIDAWDFRRVEAGLRRLDELGCDHLLGIVTLGAAAIQGARREPLGFLTRLSLQDLVRDERFNLDKEFTLDGVDRQIYELSAEASTEAGGRTIGAGQKLRIVTTATPHVEDLLELIDGWALPHHLGELYYRAPGEDERLSMTLDNVLNAVAPGPAEPELSLDVRRRRRQRGRWLMRVTLHNPSRERTDLALVDFNYVELEVENGTIGRVRWGDFWRFDKLRRNPDGTTTPTFGQANTVRLFQPLLEAGQTLTSGDIELRFRGRDPGLHVAAKFMVPDGREVKVERHRWTG